MSRECKACGAWTCGDCGWQRKKANLTFKFHECRKCGSTHGTMRGARHRNEAMTDEHEAAYAKEIAEMGQT